MPSVELNLDGLVGPTHNYSGLAFGNVASQSNKEQIANPRVSALQGLAKMKALHDLGFVQGVLAPQERPSVATLRRLGFSGSDRRVIEQAAKQAPKVLAAVSSAASMWTANAATVSPGPDTIDGRVHFTAANLNSHFHRALEHETTSRLLKAIFQNETQFAHHRALPSVLHFADEGAANHNRLCKDYGLPGVELFVYGRRAFDASCPQPCRYPARQTLEACEAIVRLHGLAENRVVYAQQNPAVIDQGVFHNDVIAVANGEVLFYHQEAFLDTEKVLAELAEKLSQSGGKLQPLCVPTEAVSVADAVSSYLFNSQLLTRLDGRTLLVVPEECQQNPRVAQYLSALLETNGAIAEVKFFDLKQSMQNGGGPACLRLRVALTQNQLIAVNPAVLLNEALYQKLSAWVNKHYRDRLTFADLADPQLLIECRTALDELSQLLQLASVYPFQLD
ncbi:succinylarginine dihydrolase [Ventosimonas gracilis]|uniref:N-succinylarginine dihydrolase n=1 Tax=Ventosimonas gracilis TaxID=1680762 RepID=A0A139SQG8_9GAMM|nr:N-succinylarginine dihydrolase [Ventosimonas gracilis]KXU36772.1 succinylarginine dihydrolase [Ventosimonas gracilis]